MNILILNVTLSQTNTPGVKAKIEVTKLADNVYRFVQNDFVNILVIIGPDGAIIVDSGFDNNPYNGYINSPASIKEELKKLGCEKIKYIINTHVDFEHAYGNTELGKGATIIAHRLGRQYLENIDQFPREGLPNLVFQDSLRLNFNNEEIAIFYLPGHTNHDIVIYLKNAKIVCTGDLLFPDSFGYLSDGGNIYSMIKAMDVMYKRFPDDVTFMSGHNHLFDRKYLLTYKDMLEKTLAIITKEVKKGNGPAEMNKADVLKDWKSWNGVFMPVLNANQWIYLIYKNICNKASAAEKINEILSKLAMEQAKPETLRIIKQKDRYYFLEAEFNFYGYMLLNQKNVDKAIEMFKYAVELFPQSANTYDSLGEAYMVAGNKDLAIKNYEKSLELNPQNNNAVEQLKKLKE